MIKVADFIPTEAEKSTASCLGWDNEALGKLTKYIALLFSSLPADKNGSHRVLMSSCAMMLVGGCIEANATTATIEFGGFSHKDQPSGDWEIVVRKKL